VKSITLYEPAMCCSTGVCGPSPDQELVRMAGDLKKLADQGVKVYRYNLSQSPEVFAIDKTVKTLLKEQGQKVLPIIVVDGEVKLTGRYPTKDELRNW